MKTAATINKKQKYNNNSTKNIVAIFQVHQVNDGYYSKYYRKYTA